MTSKTRKLAIIALATAVVLVVAALTLRKGANAAVQGAPQAGSASAAAARQTPSDIDGLLAPIALYPDALLAQILLSAMDAPNVVKLNEFLKANSALKGTELQDAAVVAGFEPSFVALALFPQVVSTMAGRLDWTTLVGQIFAADKAAVFASIQKLRGQAQTAGNLKSNSQQQVETQKTTSGDQVIVIEPTNPQIVYVPQYNSTVVYTQPATTTVVVEQSSGVDAAAAGLIGFTAGVVIGAAVNNNYYYGPYGWHGGAYMYNDAWDDYYDHREDAREDWQDHREDLAEERGDRAKNGQEQRTDRQENRQENRPESQGQRANAQGQAQQKRTDAQSQRQASGAQAGTQSTQQRTARSSGYESRGYSSSSSGSSATTSTTQRSSAADRSGTRSDAFSGYSSGQSERAASDRGRASRSSSSSRGGSRGGGGRRR